MEYFLGEESQRDIHQYYELTKNELGKGSYGTVTMGLIRGTSIKRAVKVIDKSKVSNVERFKLEVEIMMRLDHPSILRLYDYFEDKKFIYLVLELCSGGELFDKIISNKYYGEDEARIIFRQIISAIYYCHLSGVCHRDLKPENFIMISKKDPHTLKVIDFGLSRTFASATSGPLADMKGEPNSPANSPAKARRQTKAVLKTKAGTPFYIAPEVLTGNYNEKCDVWSCGVILYILLCGYPPFYGESNKEILEAVKKGKLDFSTKEWADKSKQVLDLIRKMITNHEQRLFADEVLKHTWMQSKSSTIEPTKIKEIFHNMKEFAKLNLFRKTVIYFIARNLYEEQLVPLHQYFHFFDPFCQGSINFENFRDLLKTHCDISEKQAQEVFHGLDIFDQKTISYSLFVSAAFSLSDFMNETRLHLFFLLADLDRNDQLSTKDLEKFLNIQFKHRTNIPEKFKTNVVSQFNELKLNDTSFKEFYKIIQPTS